MFRISCILLCLCAGLLNVSYGQADGPGNSPQASIPEDRMRKHVFADKFPSAHLDNRPNDEQLDKMAFQLSSFLSYPPILSRRNLSGIVVVQFSLDYNGAIDQVQVFTQTAQLNRVASAIDRQENKCVLTRAF